MGGRQEHSDNSGVAEGIAIVQGVDTPSEVQPVAVSTIQSVVPDAKQSDDGAVSDAKVSRPDRRIVVMPEWCTSTTQGLSGDVLGVPSQQVTTPFCHCLLVPSTPTSPPPLGPALGALGALGVPTGVPEVCSR